VLFNKMKTELIQFPPASPQTSYAIPESVTSIEFAFQGCASLVSITIPSRVTSIESRAFEGCTSLASVTIPSSVTSIGSDAFSNCVSLASISVDSGNTAYSSDDYGVLFNKMKTELIQFPPASPQTSYAIPEGVTLIRYSAFRSVLPHSADIPASVTAIGAGAFSGCASLISLSIPSSVTAIGDGAFAGCASLASVAIPTSVTSIGIYAFAGCAPLSSLAIPASVVTNSFGAFIGCEGPLYYEAQGAPDSWILWDFGYDGQVFWGQSPPEPDTVAPVLSEGFAARTSAASATVSFASSEAGSCYYAIVAAGSPAPVIDASGVGSPLAAGVQSLSLDGLGSAAAWDVYLVGKDAAGNVSVPLKIAIPDYVVSVAQHDGIDRFATAVKASQKAYPDPSKVDAVVLAYAYDFPDALAASYLAGALGAPILLTDSGALDAITEEEIRRLAPSVVYIVGGTGSVSDAVAGAVGAYPSVSSVTRLGGEGREETAYLIAREAAAQRGAPSTAFVVDAKNFPDALSAGSLAASQGAPILLTGTGTLDFWAQRFLEESAIGDIVVVGGPGSVPAQVEEQLRALSHAPAVTRWSGTDRYETSADALNKGIAKWGINPTVIGLASGDGFPDALVGGAAIGGRGGLLAITDPDELSVAATSLINTYKGAINGIEIFGGPGTIRVQGAVQTLLG
jgi:putative cell wall-binding protein